MKRAIKKETLVKAVKKLVLKASFELEPAVERLLKKAARSETSAEGKIAFSIILENIKIAGKQSLPICQDTGLSVFLIELGREARLGFDLHDAINEALRQATACGCLRRSVADPLSRKNTGDNAPAIVHVTLVGGNRIRLRLMLKGAGSENKSMVRMLTPADGREGIKKFVLEAVEKAGGQACPPIFIGLGIGGDLELCAILAKRALARKAGAPSKDRELAKLEREILREVNRLGIGPAGLGGKCTCLAVAAEKAPCHIASLPVAVNIQCWAHRGGAITL